MQDMETDILEYLKASDEPKSVSDISTCLGITREAALRSLKELKDNNRIIEKSSNRRSYYIANNEGITAEDFSKLKTKSLEILVPAKAASDEILEEFDNLKKDTKNIYTNIISIMGVFVAIFSIVLAGSNVVFQSTYTTWTWDTFWAFLATEISVILVIGAMLFFIKIFLK